MENIYNLLCEQCIRVPEKIAFISLEGSTVKEFSYAELYAIVQSKSNELRSLKTGEPVLLLYNDTVEFLTSFLACQRQGLICIPMFFPNNKRHFERLSGILKSSGSIVALTSLEDLDKVREGLLALQSNMTVLAPQGDGVHIDKKSAYSDISFIQYTSGSTSDPKGVVVSHNNLMANQKMLKEVFNCNNNSVILSWLPFYHDMGLIGSLLHTIYSGCTCVLMKPSSVVNSPIEWFKKCSEYKITHTGGPNFIYDMCNAIPSEQLTDVDLSTLKVIYNGSEPVKADTVRNFTSLFSAYGLAKEAYNTCYGLAEATLVVSGGIPQFSTDSISSGTISSDFEVLFFDHNSGEVDEEKGEICISGDSVMSTYWNLDSSPFFINHKNKSFFRTGDLGKLQNDQLIVNGRLKEMLILNGQNIFPYDLEVTIARLDAAILENGVSISEEKGKLYVFSELSREMIRANDDYFQELRNKIDKELIDTIGVNSEAVVFVLPRSLPRTSSGKIRRTAMLEQWRLGKLNEIGAQEVSKKVNSAFNLDSFEWSEEAVDAYLVNLIQEKLKIRTTEEVHESTLFEMGLSSIKAVEIVNKINQDLGLNVSLEKVFEQKYVRNVTQYLLSLKWLNSVVDNDKEIEL